ncbi:MAG: molybdate ABC transporter substrate-binding protein [Archangium sp.]|nr:molybdate ABC transporter substrate-binding protein [Archangium sp.]
MRRGLYLAVVSLGVGCTKPSPSPPSPLRVAAAADLTRVFSALGPRFTAEHGYPLTFTFAATGVLAKQLEQGAPYGVFAAADTAAVDAAIASGACRAPTRHLFARGRLAVVTAANVEPPRSLAELSNARFTRIAIANPAHAPYGRAAMAALTAAGIADGVRAKLVYADNVAHALTLVATGNAEAGLISRALLTTDAGTPVDSALHTPIDQALVACAAHPGAEAFIDFVLGHADAFAAHGFEQPAEPQR